MRVLTEARPRARVTASPTDSVDDSLFNGNVATRNLADGFTPFRSNRNRLTLDRPTANLGIGFYLYSDSDIGGSTANAVDQNIGNGNQMFDARDDNALGANQWTNNRFGAVSFTAGLEAFGFLGTIESNPDVSLQRAERTAHATLASRTPTLVPDLRTYVVPGTKYSFPPGESAR